MKKILSILLLGALLLLCFAGCTTPTDPQGGTETDPESAPVTDETDPEDPNEDDPGDTAYKLTVCDYWGYLVNSLDEYYEAGEEVEVTLEFLSGPSVGIELNGEYIG
ncbi:MAG: hypothetical protein IIY01_04045, partial [Clostridia bacterium]|nr:hypothetical protein [Clostridia bacterium]